MWIWLRRLFESRKAREARVEAEQRAVERELAARATKYANLGTERRNTTFVPPREAPRLPPEHEDPATRRYYSAIEQYQRKQHEADSRAKLRQPAPAARFTRRKDDEPRDTMAGSYLDSTNPLSITSPLNPIYSSSSDAPPSCDSGSSSSSGDSSSCGSSGGDW